MEAIRTVNLSKSYGKKMAVDHLEMVVMEGAVYGFIGQNGAGKSTTQKLICGLTAPTSGDIKLYGKSYQDAKVRSRVGMLIENAGVYPGLTSRENLMLYGLAIGVKHPDAEIGRVLKLVGLSDTGKKKVKQFSLGMKQRLGIAIALLGDPRLLILDEPINGLDPEGIIEFREIVTRLNRELGMTILISSHILGELSKISTHYGILKDGAMVQQVSAGELEASCQTYLCVKAQEPEAALGIIGQNMPVKQYEISEKTREIKLFGAFDSKKINRILVEKGIGVEEIYTYKQDLEDYFLHFTGGMAHA